MRLLFHTIIHIVLCAAALVVVGVAVPNVEVQVTGFLIALGVFALAQAVLGPFVVNIANRYAPALAGGVGLVSTFLALWIATLFRDGIRIETLEAWIITPIIVWVITAVGGWVLMAFVVDRWLKKRATAKVIARSQPRAEA